MMQNTVNIYENPVPTAGITPDPASIMENSNLQLNGNPAGGSGNYISYQWTGDANWLNFNNIVNPVFNCPATGNYTLVYTVTDDNTCQASDTVGVTVFYVYQDQQI